MEYTAYEHIMHVLDVTQLLLDKGMEGGCGHTG